MSKVIVRAHQVGISDTPTSNFTLQTPAVPDGTMKFARGVPDATTQDIFTVGVDGRVKFNQGITGLEASTVPNGWQKLPSGVLIQWMYLNNTNNAGTGLNSNSFPMAFPNACNLVLGNAITAASRGFADASALPVAWSASGWSWMSFNANGSVTSASGQIAATFLAIGF
jgi:hypothetical protein